jgi:hypothetical protein
LVNTLVGLRLILTPLALLRRTWKIYLHTSIQQFILHLNCTNEIQSVKGLDEESNDRSAWLIGNCIQRSKVCPAYRITENLAACEIRVVSRN